MSIIEGTVLYPHLYNDGIENRVVALTKVIFFYFVYVTDTVKKTKRLKLHIALDKITHLRFMECYLPYGITMLIVICYM